MEISKWNKKQQELFELFFNKQINEDHFRVSEIMGIMNIHTLKWKELYEVLKINSKDFDDYTNISKVKIIKYNESTYLIIKTNIWNYLCIDITKKIVVGFGKDLYPFNEDFFINNFDEDKLEHPNLFYNSLSFNEKEVPTLVNFIEENGNVLLEPNFFSYEINDKKDFKASLMFDIDRGKLTVYLGNINHHGNVNYIFFNSDLLPVGVSNQTGNKEELFNMAIRVRDIKIPISVFPKHLLGEKNVKSIKCKKMCF
jgi:hypothetical protein